MYNIQCNQILRHPLYIYRCSELSDELLRCYTIYTLLQMKQSKARTAPRRTFTRSEPLQHTYNLHICIYSACVKCDSTWLGRVYAAATAHIMRRVRDGVATQQTTWINCSTYIYIYIRLRKSPVLVSVERYYTFFLSLSLSFIRDHI